MNLTKLIIAALSVFLFSGCEIVVSEDAPVSAPYLSVDSVRSVNSGSHLIWSIDVRSQYDGSSVGIGAWNYDDRYSQTKISCNNGVLDCREISKIECDLISSTGSDETFECIFITSSGYSYYGNSRYITVPYSVYDNSAKTETDTLMSPSISVRNYSGDYLYDIPFVFNVWRGEFERY